MYTAYSLSTCTREVLVFTLLQVCTHNVHTVARRVPATTGVKTINYIFLVGLLLKVFVV